MQGKLAAFIQKVKLYFYPQPKKKCILLCDFYIFVITVAIQILFFPGQGLLHCSRTEYMVLFDFVNDEITIFLAVYDVS